MRNENNEMIDYRSNFFMIISNEIARVRKVEIRKAVYKDLVDGGIVEFTGYELSCELLIKDQINEYNFFFREHERRDVIKKCRYLGHDKEIEIKES